MDLYCTGHAQHPITASLDLDELNDLDRDIFDVCILLLIHSAPVNHGKPYGTLLPRILSPKRGSQFVGRSSKRVDQFRILRLTETRSRVDPQKKAARNRRRCTR